MADLEGTFPSLHSGFIPQTADEFWEDYDVRKEPLEVETLHEWEEDEMCGQVISKETKITKKFKE